MSVPLVQINSCFFNSQSPICSSTEVITLIVLGILGLLCVAGASYGYIFNSYWIPTAYFCGVGLLIVALIAGGLVLIKSLKKT